MRKQIILLSIFLFSIHFLTAQHYLDNFKPLASEGEIPSDFKALINKKTNAADFNMFLKEMFLRGNVLYGNKLNQYINTIADNVLKDYPALRNELRFYILKSPVVNASATENGIILINVGLMAQVSNESELAFIIAHEIVHYVEHHLIHLNNYEDKLNKKEYKDYYLKYHNRSREQEIEADKLGFERYYKHSSYSYAAINGLFDVLQYSELPFDEIPFPRSYMETDFYQFPDNYFLSAVTPVRSRDDYVDTLSTHPNIQKRRENIQYLSSGLSDEGRKIFVQSEALFKEVRDLARFECINLYLTQHDFEEAFYNTFILEQSFPDNSFLRMAKTASIYGIAKCKSQGRLSQAIENYKKREGEIQQISYFFSKISKKELLVLTLRFAWEAHCKDKDNVYLLNITKDLLQEVSVENKMGYIDFCDYPMGTNIDSLPEEPEIVDTVTITSKYQRIKQQTKNTKVKPTDKFTTLNYMLVDLRREDDFIDLWNIVVKNHEDEKIRAVIEDKSTLNINKLLIIKPYYFISSKKRNEKVVLRNYAKAEAESDELSKTIQTSIHKLGLPALLYTADNIKQFNTEQYNQYAIIQSWIQDFISAEDVEMIHYQSTNMQDVVKETGCDAINLIIARKSRDKFVNAGKVFSFLEAAFCPVVAPVMIARIALPRYEIKANFIVIDIEKGEVKLNRGIEADGSNYKAYINSFIYNMYAKINKEK